MLVLFCFVTHPVAQLVRGFGPLNGTRYKWKLVLELSFWKPPNPVVKYISSGDVSKREHLNCGLKSYAPASNRFPPAKHGIEIPPEK